MKITLRGVKVMVTDIFEKPEFSSHAVLNGILF